MTTQAPDTQDDDILALMALDEQLRSGLSLSEAVRTTMAEFPLHAVSIADYAAQSSVLGRDESIRESLPIAARDPLVSLIEKMAQTKLQLQPGDTISSLISRAEQVLGSSAQLAQTLTVGHSLLLKLDRRMIQFGTIPTGFLQALATQLHLSRAALDDYLQMPPRLALGAEYKSRKRPAATTQTFDQAIAASIAAGEIESGSQRWDGTSD